MAEVLLPRIALHSETTRRLPDTSLMTDDNNDVGVPLYTIFDTFICSGVATQGDSQQILTSYSNQMLHAEDLGA